MQGDALDASNAKEFKAKVAALMTPGTKLIFELSSLKFVDSSGLGALLSCLRQLNASGGALKLCAMVKPVRALFELVRMHRVFEIFNTQEEALEIANDTLYGLGSGIWTRDINTAYRFGRGIKAGRVWTNCYHAYPAHAAFGGYKKSGIGRETHKMMLDHYQQTKNMLVSYSPKALGFF